MLVFLFFINSILASFDRDATVYTWLVLSQNPPKGRCVEVDRETGGKIFQKKATQDRCRPKSDQLKTLWYQNPDGPDGSCYLVDSESGGRVFSKTTPQKDCEPSNLEEHIIEGKCYLKGVLSDGNVFLIKGSKDRCKPKGLKPQFVISANGLSGRCVSLDSESGEVFNENLDKCKPAETQFVTIKEANQSVCYETSSSEGYIKKVNNSFCRPKDRRYKWIQDKVDSGTCYLLSVDSSNYQEKVTYEKCVPLFKASVQFTPLSLASGTCHLVDRQTRGGVFKVVVALDKCRPQTVELSLLMNENQKYCLEVDPTDRALGFRKSVPLKYCHDNQKVYSWKSDSKEMMKGLCYEQYLLGEVANYKSVQKELCRPKKIKNVWYFEKPEDVLKAECYEVDSENGPKEYVNQVAKKNCRPKGEALEVKYFHPSKFTNGGCYLVDKTTLGAKFSQRTDDKKCKEIMFPE